MNWTVALGLGMWSASCFQDLEIPWPVTTWGVLGLLHVLVPLAEWCRLAPFVLLGWGFGSWNLSPSESDMTFHGPTSPTLMCLDCAPTFTASLGRSTQHGVFLCQNDLGQRGALWLSVPDTALHMAGRKWVRVTSPRPFDLSDAFDFPAHLASLGVDCVGQFLGESNVNSRDASPPAWADRWRAWVKCRLSADKSGLALGMFAGDKNSVSREVQHALRQLGLSHLLAVSGYHVSLVSLVFFLLMQRQQRVVRLGSGIGVVAVWAFVAATDWPLSAVRAAVMASLGWWYLVRGKSLQTWGMLGVAGCVVAVVDPMSPLQLGAQLSFAATAALISLKRKYLALRVPLRAQWATLPWNVHDFQTFPLLFYPANLLAALAVWALACCVAGAGLGVGWFMRGLEWMGEVTLTLAEEVNCWEGLTWNVAWIGRSGLGPLVWGTALLWVCPLLQGSHRQVWVRHAMGVSALIGAWATLETRGISCKGSPHHRLWHVSARSPTWLMEDGWRGEVWTSSSRDSVHAAHLANHLGLAHVAWNTSWDGPDATKSQPPVEVWDFGQNPGVTCQVTLERQVNSVSGAE